MTNDARMKMLEKTLERIHLAIHATDSKVYSVITLDALLVGALVAMMPAANAWTTAKVIALALTCCPITCSLVFVLLVATPRLGAPRGSLLFFQTIQQKPVEEFGTHTRAASEESYIEDLIVQVHRNSQIAVSKYRYLAVSIIALICVLPLWLVSIFYLRI